MDSLLHSMVEFAHNMKGSEHSERIVTRVEWIKRNYRLFMKLELLINSYFKMEREEENMSETKMEG